MSDLKFNSIAGAVLASVLGVMGIATVTDSVMHPHYPEKAGWLPEADLTVGGGGGGSAPEGPPDFGTLFADPAGYAELVARGDRVRAVCNSCHTFDAGGPNGTGPNLHAVFGSRAGTHAGYNYSDAMASYGETWSYNTLDAYLRSPSSAVRGNKMAFAGIRNTQDRVAVIAYLRSISPNQLPLPAPLPPPAETAEAGEGAAPAQDPAAPGAAPQGPAPTTPGAH